MRPQSPQPVKYFIGVLYSDPALAEEAQLRINEQIDPCDWIGEPFPFEKTDYYNKEMGAPIFRRFLELGPLASPGDLARLKIVCNEMEEGLAIDGSRKVNLDIGYLDLHKVILASAKYNGQKIYIGEGIYADPTLVFESGSFQALENTFPDFKDGQYFPVFKLLRQHYKYQLRTGG